MDVPLYVWAITVAGIVAMIAYDFVVHVRTPHSPSIKEAAVWSAAYIGIAVLFGLGVLVVSGSTFGGEYFAGYITEKSLSVDNLFVFVLIMSSFAVPREYQQKVLLIGIALALVFRTIFIALGTAVIANFAWIFYIFGAFLIYTAWVQAKAGRTDSHADDEFEENAVLRLARRVLPTTDEYHGDKFTTKVDGKRLVTPLLVVMIAIGSADLLFAVDSIPAIFGLTQEPYLVFTANAFSLLGLRQLYFLIDGLLDRLVYLHYGLAAILGFIGVKLLLHALHENELPFINGGEHVPVWEVPTWLSLLFIVVALGITTVLSLRENKRTAARADADEPGANRPTQAPSATRRPVGEGQREGGALDEVPDDAPAGAGGRDGREGRDA
ncbi:TerC family protein [uncultured Pseudokineococcus sp.]|uniref:TerC family protein n=1 Tax=uncultured Pseudokineococcus sp. TaxID=1642928 RepID=UPI0026274EC6|nr:TerC family protein [uncultured Pseudokineococcus sp.]